jgi:hypothetical protein
MNEPAKNLEAPSGNAHGFDGYEPSVTLVHLSATNFGSRGRNRTSDLLVMSQTSYLCSTLRHFKINLPTKDLVDYPRLSSVQSNLLTLPTTLPALPNYRVGQEAFLTEWLQLNLLYFHNSAQLIIPGYFN